MHNPGRHVNIGQAARFWLAIAVSVAVLLTGARQVCHAQSYELQYVKFDDIVPSYLTLTQSWNALGLDDQDNVYIIWTSTRDDGREDAALFRYSPRTGERKFLGTFIDVATEQNNLEEGEQIPKGHTHIVQIGRKLYMGSQGFHDFKQEIDDLPQYRGAHLFTYDLDTGAFDDVSRNLPGGVVIEHEGIVALSYSPEHKLLVGLSHPLGHIVLIDPKDHSVRKVVDGIPWQLNHNVSREILVTKAGKIYTYRGPEEPEYRDEENEVWVYDLNHLNEPAHGTGQVLTGGFWNGLAETKRRNTVYLNTVSGELYKFDVRTETFTHLTHFIDDETIDEDKGWVRYLYGITLTPDESRIVGVPFLNFDPGPHEGEWSTRAVTYNLCDGSFETQFESDTPVFTGSSNIDRKGNIYMAAFNWSTDAKLGVLKPTDDRAYKFKGRCYVP